MKKINIYHKDGHWTACENRVRIAEGQGLHSMVEFETAKKAEGYKVKVVWVW